MLGLSPLGLLHTGAALLALGCAVVVVARHHRMAVRDAVGFTYLTATALTALTSLFLYRRGVFGPAHILAVLTLLGLLIERLASMTPVFGRWAAYVQTAALSATLLFHAVPGVTETLTRLPPQQPLLAPDAAPFKAIYGVLLALFVGAVALQWRGLRRRPA